MEADLPAAVDLLERIVNINSGTLNPAGVRRVGEILRPEFEALGFNVRWIPMDEVKRAGHLVAERKGTKGKKVLIIGHMDTVFELSSPFQKWTRDGNTGIGPGTSDMKGGIVILLLALKAMHRSGALDDTSITVFLTGDEERVGEPLSISRRDLIEAGKRSDAALEYEGGSRVDGREFATIGRRSSSSWTLRVTAQEGHSSGIFNPRAGSGAVYEISRILAAFHEQLQEPGATFNTGILLAGAQVQFDEAKFSGSVNAKSNIIPPAAIASGDLRTLTEEQTQRVREKMKQIVAKHLPRTSAEITFEDKYPAMAVTDGNQGLLKLLNGVNRDLNMEAMEALDPSRRGAGDISFVAPFVSGLSGLGANGGGAHAPGETIDLTRIPVQAKRSPLLIYRLTH
ncbi:MAG: M20/M25/M40 family metallo-hydrolase [Bryobacteraceae bacterium]|nr:M20/M25/M40 family metallo-hydrolase [Bryobacteraceae bacterium]